MTVGVAELRERIRALPGMDRLLPALDGLPPAYLVGGAVRDLMLGTLSPDLDIAVEADAHAAARALAERLGGVVREHDRFATATVYVDTNLSIDVAQTRTERYPTPGSLPVVAPAPLSADLRRRDFTINAMAVALRGDELGHLHDPSGGRRDLDARLVRILHEQSFLDDPTRLLRAVRYEVRLGFRMDSETERLAREAVDIGAMRTISGARLRDALFLLLAEHDAPSALGRLHDLGVDRSLHRALHFDATEAASAAIGAHEVGADRVLAVLAMLVAHDPEELVPWLDSLGLDRDQRERVRRAARDAPALVEGLRAVPELSPSAVYALLHDEPPEALALALALGVAPVPILEYGTRLRFVRLDITGNDLIAAGLEPGPELGRVLAETLRAKLDGDVAGRDDELRYALRVAR
jgi:tRNA nucleotidyltransferase (CCA-adding enzyme)